MNDVERKVLTEKWNRLCPGKGVPFEPEHNQEPVDNGRLAYINSMSGYKGIDDEQYQEILGDNQFIDLNAVPHTKVDQDYIIGRMAEKFGG